MLTEMDEQLKAYWNTKAPKEPLREQSDPKKRIHTDLLWRMIMRNIPHEKITILDAGGGAGRFSLELAEKGYHVTHFDLSPEMITIAKAEARKRNLENIYFIEGSVTDLSQFESESFDVVLCLDAPISFCFDQYSKAMDEVLRVCKSTAILCVMNRLGVIVEGGINFDLLHFGTVRTVKDVFATGNLVVTDELKKLQNLTPSWHAFTPEELTTEVEKRGFQTKELIAPGTLSTFVNPERLQTLYEHEIHYLEYLEFEEIFDSHPSVLGIGSFNAGGLAIVAHRVRRESQSNVV
jgi:ubiquinone/menaquinone biosynthesis C-methylase UbiE